MLSSVCVDASAVGGVEILDPCCGSCSLLLCAAALYPDASLVGVDCDRDAFAGAHADFEAQGLPCPTLATGDVLEPLTSLELSTPGRYSAIICDPPYGVKASIEGGGSIFSSSEAVVAIREFTRALLAIACRSLGQRGRVVFFLPARCRFFLCAQFVDPFKMCSKSRSDGLLACLHAPALCSVRECLELWMHKHCLDSWMYLLCLAAHACLFFAHERILSILMQGRRWRATIERVARSSAPMRR